MKTIYRRYCLSMPWRVICLLAGLQVLLPPKALAGQYLDFSYAASGGAVTITRYTGAGGAVDIPTTIEGLPVNAIGDGAFYGYTNLTSVTIPNTAISIGYQTFSGCTGLKSVEIGSGMIVIGDWAFSGCASLAPG